LRATGDEVLRAAFLAADSTRVPPDRVVAVVFDGLRHHWSTARTHRDPPSTSKRCIGSGVGGDNAERRSDPLDVDDYAVRNRGSAIG